MKKQSAGLLMFRRREQVLEVLLAHPGGPFWKNKDAGAWSIPKGELEAGEEPLAAAQREFEEELGIKPQGPFFKLGSVTQKSGKVVQAWAFEGDCDPSAIRGNTFEIEWPPKSGKKTAFPERLTTPRFFSLKEEAAEKLNPAQGSLTVHACRGGYSELCPERPAQTLAPTQIAITLLPCCRMNIRVLNRSNCSGA